ncbi:hypothetical protein ACFUJY_29565 [Streptomyces sp. NPDC057249]|uniref:hypothetical protein n=1 Tax=Streptomyces sp. NPDC057249 TaxID=3346067 RepID=UPI0036295EE7
MSSIDYTAIRAKARAEVDDELGEIIDPRERRMLAEEIRDQAYMEMSMLRDERQQLVAAAALYEYAPDLHEKFGIGRTHLRRLTMTFLHKDLDREQQINPPRWPAAPEIEWRQAGRPETIRPLSGRVEAARKAGLPHPKDVVDQAAAICARYEEAAARRRAAISHLGEAGEELRTAGGRVDVGRLERPDFATIREQARTAMLDELAAVDGSSEERLRSAAEAVDYWEDAASELLPKRDAAMFTLAFYTTAHGVYYSAGINRNAFNRALARALGLPGVPDLPKRDRQPAAARTAGVRFVKNADIKLPEIAQEYEAAKARQAAAIQVRNELIPVLAAEDWTAPQIAEAIDRDGKIVRRLLAAAAEDA